MSGSGDRVAIVTGSGRGIGKTIVRVLAQKGMRVGLNDINLALAESAAQELRAEGLKVWALPGDVSRGAGPSLVAGEQCWHLQCCAHIRVQRGSMGQSIPGGCQGRFPVFASSH